MGTVSKAEKSPQHNLTQGRPIKTLTPHAPPHPQGMNAYGSPPKPQLGRDGTISLNFQWNYLIFMPQSCCPGQWRAHTISPHKYLICNDQIIKKKPKKLYVLGDGLVIHFWRTFLYCFCIYFVNKTKKISDPTCRHWANQRGPRDSGRRAARRGGGVLASP